MKLDKRQIATVFRRWADRRSGWEPAEAQRQAALFKDELCQYMADEAEKAFERIQRKAEALTEN